MKRALSLLFACLAVLWLSAQADTLTLPANLQTIDDEAFYGDTSLDTVTLGDQVTSIGEKAFANSTLRKIDLPESIDHIADNAFDGVDHPEINANKGTYAYDWAVDNSFIDDDITPSPLEDFVIENGVVTKYVGKGGDVVVPKYSSDGKRIIEIGDEAFFFCDTVTSITLPEGLTSIGDGAFGYCMSLTSINLPEGLTSIGDTAFGACISLTSITFPEGLTSIGSAAFGNCSSLTSIILPEGLTSIGYAAFSHCSNLTSIILPEGLTSIGYRAFSFCSNLTSINLPEGLTSIGDGTFEYCGSLTSIILPEGLTLIALDAFRYCRSLTCIVIPKSVTYIGLDAFYVYGRNRDLVIYGVKGSYAEKYANREWIQFKEGIAPQQDVHFSISHKIEGTVLAQGSVSGSFAMSPEASPNATSTLNVTSDYIWTVTASDTSWMKAEKIDNATCRLTLLEADPGKSYTSTLTFTVAGQYQYTVNVTLSKPALPVGKPVIKNATTNTIFTAAQTVEYKTSDGNIALVLSAENGCGQYKLVVIALDEAPDFTSAGSNQAERRDTSLFTSNDGYAYNDVIPASLYNEYVNEYKGIPIALNDIPDGKYIKIAVGAYANETDAEPEIWTNIGLKIKKTYAVTGVQLDKSALTLQVGESATLTATITPSNATNKSVRWSSSNTSVAIVNGGNVKAVSEGTATITVKSDDGGKAATCNVNVKPNTNIDIHSLQADKTYNVTDVVNNVRNMNFSQILAVLYNEIVDDMDDVDAYEMLTEHPIKTPISAVGYVIGIPKPYEDLYNSYYEDAASSVMFYLSGANKTEAGSTIETLNKWKKLFNVVDVGFNVISSYKLMGTETISFKEMIGGENFNKLPNGKIKDILGGQNLKISKDILDKMAGVDPDALDYSKAFKNVASNIIDGIMLNVYQQAALEVFDSQIKEVIYTMDSNSLYGQSLQKVMDEVQSDKSIIRDVAVDIITDSVGELTNPTIDFSVKTMVSGELVDIEALGGLTIDFVTEAWPAAKAVKLGWNTGTAIADTWLSTKNTAQAMREYSILIVLLDHAYANMKSVANNIPNNATAAQIAQLRSTIDVYYNILSSTIDAGRNLITVLNSSRLKEWSNGGSEYVVGWMGELENVRRNYSAKLIELNGKLIDICPDAASSNYL